MLAVLVLGCLAVFGVAYLVYGRLLARLFGLDAQVPTPAHLQQDGEDFVPTGRFYLLSQHFSAISAAGPIAGPILACAAFGWGPALLWIVLGCVFIGAMHDMAALVGSLRHRACSVAEILKEHLNKRTYVLFTLYIWLALVYVIIAFTDITARAFVENLPLPGERAIPGAAVASSSMLYLGLAVVMGLFCRAFRPRLLVTTLIFVPLVLVAIWAGPHLPFELRAPGAIPSLYWVYGILAYCGVASLLPVWLLLQPRGYLGGFFLYVTLFGGLLGLLVKNPDISFDAFKGFTSAAGQPLVPFLFITIACGACSGFHGLVCSGTTSKQIDREPDARAVGYGGMLLEGVVAVLSLACVMILAPDHKVGGADKVFGWGIGSFLNALGVPFEFALTFGMLAFATFVYDTLDVCTRLARYLFTEFTGWRGRSAGIVGTVITLAIPAWICAQTVVQNGKPMPAYVVIWPLFGSTNQLLAGLTLVGLLLWLVHTKKPVTLRVLVGVPMLFMMGMTMSALVLQITQKGASPAFVGVGTVLLLLAAWVAAEGLWALIGTGKRLAVSSSAP